MAKRKLTDSVVRRLEPPTKGLRIYRDAALRGFGVRVLESGSRAFVLDFTAQTGKRHVYTVSPFTGYGGGETDKARREALLLQARIRTEGYDPADAKRARRAVAIEAWTVSKLCDEFESEAERKIKRGKLRVHTRDQYLVYTAALRGKFGSRLIAAITKEELQRWHDQLSDESGPVAANAILGLTRSVFAFAIERGKLATNPAKAIARNKTNSRERVLDKKERKAIWNASEKLAYPHREIARLLLLLGQRRSEVSEMRWAELDFQNAEWTLPPERTKNGRRHLVPLPPMAMEILSNTPRKSAEYVFSTTGHSPPGNFSDVKIQLDKLSSVTLWTWHDLRRTCATAMAEIGIDVQVTERLLNHVSGSQAGIVRVYQKHDYKSEVRKALVAWEHYLLHGEQPNVVDLNARRASGT